MTRDELVEIVAKAQASATTSTGIVDAILKHMEENVSDEMVSALLDKHYAQTGQLWTENWRLSISAAIQAIRRKA